MKVLVEHFDEVVNRLEITQVVIVHVHANAKVEASVAAIDDFEVSELKKNKILWVDEKITGISR